MTSTHHQRQNWQARCSFGSFPGISLSILEFLGGRVSRGHLLLLPCILVVGAEVAEASSGLPTSKLPLCVCSGAGFQQRARRALEPTGSSVSLELNLPVPHPIP